MEIESHTAELATKRRSNVERKKDIPLAFQLILLLRTRKEVMYLCTRSSLALRIVILCELALDKVIELRDGKVHVAKAPANAILREFTDRIAQVSLGPRDMLAHLNGEKGKQTGVDGLRRKIYAEMRAQGLIKTSKGFFFNKIRIQNMDVWQHIYDRLIHEVQNNSLSREGVVLLLGLEYINMLESLLLQCNEGTAAQIVQQVREIKKRVQSKQYGQEDTLLYQLLNLLGTI